VTVQSGTGFARRTRQRRAARPANVSRARLAAAGAFFTYTGAMVSHLTTGYDVGEVGLLAVMTVLTVLSWALRPASRRTGGVCRRGPGDRSPAARSPRRS
jgi:hypothetical protein